LKPIKGLEIFLPAFLQWLKSQSDRIRCVVVGPDEAGYRKKLENLTTDLRAKGAILFSDPLYGSDRIQAMVDSDIVVLPSFHENFGIAAVEGMACGKPVLISDQIDICSEVKQLDLGEVGALSIDGMIEALNRIILRKKEWTIIGQRGRTWAREKCNWDKISEVLFAEYPKLLVVGKEIVN